MQRVSGNKVGHFLSLLPGWILTVSGLTLWAAALLVGTWSENRELAWQLQQMHRQAQRLTEQEHVYGKFHEALAEADPVAVERMAFYQLHLRPIDAQTLNRDPLGHLRQMTTDHDYPIGSAAEPAEPLPTVEQMLPVPIAPDGVAPAPFNPVDTRLVRLSKGPGRLVLLVVGGICLFAGLQLPTHSSMP